jgi:phosphate transport system substrate-binding protein
VEEFQQLYPKTQISLSTASTREAVVKLLRGEVKTIFVSRRMQADEQADAAANRLRVDSVRFAVDGVAVLVNARNPVTRLTVEELGAVFGGTVGNWKEVGGEDLAILPVTLSRNMGSSELLLARAVKDTAFAANAFYAATSAQVVETVGGRPDAIGYVGLTWVADGSPLPAEARAKVRALELGATAEGRAYAPYQAAVYRRDYPLARDLYVLSTDRSLGVATGLIAFVAGSEGQKIVLDAGLVPATMPVRLVQFAK